MSVIFLSTEENKSKVPEKRDKTNIDFLGSRFL